MNCRRISPSLIALALGAFLAGVSGCSLLPFRHKSPKEPDEATYHGKKAGAQGLVVEMQTSPDVIKLAETRQLNVVVILRNVTRKVVTLKFPTTQSIEILLRDPNSGQIISQWSTEHSFTSDPRLAIINPQERVEYNEPITTRELKPGRAYTVEAYVVGYEKDLRVTKAVLTQP